MIHFSWPVGNYIWQWPPTRPGSRLGLRCTVLIKKFTMVSHEFIPSIWIMLLWGHGLICWFCSPLEAALTLTSKVIRLSQCMMAIKMTTIMMTTMAIMMTPMMAREMTVIMIRDAPVPHQCITVSTISSSWNTQDAHIMTIRMMMINDDKGSDDMVCYQKWQRWHCPKMTLPMIIVSICHSQHDFNLLRHARCSYQDADGSINDDNSNGNVAIVMSSWLVIHCWPLMMKTYS